MFEEQMSQKVLSFIREEGYLPLVQVAFFIGYVDFVGIKQHECLVVESKVSKWKIALKQALRYGYGAEKAYVALPAPTASHVVNKHRDIFVKYGIGIVEVADIATILLECKRKNPSSVFKQIILNEAHERLKRSNERVSKLKRRLKDD